MQTIRKDMKLTSKRQLILDKLKQSGLSSARSLAADLPAVDQATVYRTLDLLVENRVINKYYFQTSEALYEYHYANHHHAVCHSCDKVVHFEASDSQINRLLNLDEGFEAHTLEITVRGICSNESCQR